MDAPNEANFEHAAALLGVSRSTLPSNGARDLALALVNPGHRPIIVEPLSRRRMGCREGESCRSCPCPSPALTTEIESSSNSVLWFRAAQERGFGWGKLPERYSPRATKQHRWHRWVVAGTWTLIADAVQDDERLSEARRATFRRIAEDGERRRKRILDGRARLNGSP